jgi:hypothetical protein
MPDISLLLLTFLEKLKQDPMQHPDQHCSKISSYSIVNDTGTKYPQSCPEIGEIFSFLLVLKQIFSI